MATCYTNSSCCGCTPTAASVAGDFSLGAPSSAQAAHPIHRCHMSLVITHASSLLAVSVKANSSSSTCARGNSVTGKTPRAAGHVPKQDGEAGSCRSLLRVGKRQECQSYTVTARQHTLRYWCVYACVRQQHLFNIRQSTICSACNLPYWAIQMYILRILQPVATPSSGCMEVA